MNVAEDGEGGRCQSARSGRRGKDPASSVSWALQVKGKVEGVCSGRELDVKEEAKGRGRGGEPSVEENGAGGRCLSARRSSRSRGKGKVPASIVSWALQDKGKVEGVSSGRELDVEGGGEGSRSGRRA
jgi:hypothetical protein